MLRFMGTAEALKFIDEQPLLNEKVWKDHGADSESKGFCFIEIDGDKIQDTMAIFNAAVYLSGVTSMDACLVGKPTPEFAEILLRGKAHYTIGTIEELSTNIYSRDCFSEWAMYTPSKSFDIPFMHGVTFYSSDSWKEPNLVTSRGVYGS